VENALRLIPDGATITLNGDTGEVRVHAAQGAEATETPSRRPGERFCSLTRAVLSWHWYANFYMFWAQVRYRFDGNEATGASQDYWPLECVVIGR
jgi:hypothetical protein